MFTSQRKLALRLVILAAPLIGGCAHPFSEQIAERATTPAEGIKRIEVSTRNGLIEIVGTPQCREIEIAATKSARGSSPQDAREHAEQIVIRTVHDASRNDLLAVEAVMPESDFGRSYAARFEIKVPKDVTLELKTSNGRVAVRNTDGAVRVVTSNGTISVADVHGNLDLKSSNGRIEIVRSGADSIRAVTSNGSIDVTAARGNADVRSSNGSIALRLVATPAPAEVLARTSNGRILVEVPSDLSANLEMSTSNGGVHTDFEAASVRDLRTGRSSLSAKLNDGAGRVDLSSSNGSLTFRTTKIQHNPG